MMEQYIMSLIREFLSRIFLRSRKLVYCRAKNVFTFENSGSRIANGDILSFGHHPTTGKQAKQSSSGTKLSNRKEIMAHFFSLFTAFISSAISRTSRVMTSNTCDTSTLYQVTSKTQAVLNAVMQFYRNNPQIKVSHGISHVMAVYNHSVRAVQCHQPLLNPTQSMEIKVAALLHDVDDSKYFPDNKDHSNAKGILETVEIELDSQSRILRMISLVGCSENGNRVPIDIVENESYHLLIPRWCDRLEAVGAIGVVRCYQYNSEKGQPLFTKYSPRALSPTQVWELASKDRFDAYTNGKESTDMISHYYDKLLHVARPPPDIVRNQYLEDMGVESSKELVEVCLIFGQTGAVDVNYINGLLSQVE